MSYLLSNKTFRKLLKMHEAKYDPMEKADAEAIMEEILGMQCGLNPDQQVSMTKSAKADFLNLYRNLLFSPKFRICLS